MVVSRSVHIQAPVERVFALIADFAARARLNPAATPLQVEIESGRNLRVGTVCHFRLQAGGRILDYRIRIVEFIPNRRVVSRSDAPIPFEVTLETEAEGTGTRLTHSERFEPNEAMLEQVPPTSGARFLQWLDGLLPFLDIDAAQRVHAQREQLLEEKLGGNLERWLTAIRMELEKKPGSGKPL